MKVIYFGAINNDISPRVRQLRDGLRLMGVEVAECRSDGRAVPRYIQLLKRFRSTMSGADIILVAKPGQREMPLAYALGRVFDRPVVLDFFASLYLNEVFERRRVRQGTFRAMEFKLLDSLSLRIANIAIVDTWAHGNILRDIFGADYSRMRRVFVGAEDLFQPLPRRKIGNSIEVLYCGTFIPFHGVPVILKAARLLARETSISFTLLGDGQERKHMMGLAKNLCLKNVRFEDPIPYSQLPRRLAMADLCLGIFANTLTARAVIPKKVFAALACARPVVTAESNGVKEVLNEETAFFCAPDNPEDLAEVIATAFDDPVRREEVAFRGHLLHKRLFTTEAIGRSLHTELKALING